MQTQVLIYDGSFEGFLCCIFTVYEQKLTDVCIQREGQVQNGLFGTSENVISIPENALRVWKGLKDKHSYLGIRQFYYAFLSEEIGIEDTLLRYAQQAFASEQSMEKAIADPVVLKISQTARSVGREKHRMEAFVRFRLTKDGVYFASIAPDFNVLPLILTHFKNRYADQRWLIYDMQRGYGLYYDLTQVETIEIDFPKDFDFYSTSEDYFSEAELDFQQLWKDYFKSTTIASRKNMKLHIRHVPKRYWKYLSEKQPNP